MNLSDVFTTPFKLVYSHIFEDPALSLRVKLKTDDIYDKQQKKKYIFCLKCILIY